MTTHQIGVCSWSLQPTDSADLVTKTTQTGIMALQLGLDPLISAQWNLAECVDRLGDARIEILSGMMGARGEDYTTLDTIRQTGGIRPDQHWEGNLEDARHAADIAAELGLQLVTLHAGFIPEGENDPERPVMMERLSTLLDVFNQVGIKVGLETGQERADVLIEVLDGLNAPNLGVNFDPANMILYGMGDPTESLEALADHVLQIHIKDAVPTSTPGTWGSEVVVGTGTVDWARFLAIHSERIGCNLCIEREAGDNRIEDIRAAHRLLMGETE